MTEPTQAHKIYMQGYIDGAKETKAALTAVAEVGESNDIFTQVNANIKAAEARTIERCAQVAERHDCNDCGLIEGRKIAAAIRALATEVTQTSDDRCITTHLWQHTGQGGSMGKEMRCERCSKTKWVPW